MGTVQKTITLTKKQSDWISKQVDTGHFTDENEYICHLIRCDQARTSDTEAIRSALIEGEASGEPRPFDVAALKRRMQSGHG